MAKSSHPTRDRLIETMAELLDGSDPEHITADQVLTASGVSKGSLYHHFEDFEDLLEAALIARFSVNVDATIDALAQILATVGSRDDLLKALRKLNIYNQDQARSSFRLERARAAGLTYSSPRFHEALGAEQKRLTDAFTDLFIEAQNKGWMSENVDAHAAAVFVQAYTVGRVVDDIAPEKVDPAAWIDLVMHVVDKAILN
ncbi:TetR/AcrR family transcriptional regulator [Aurantimicrobium minutum]|uniref:TetR/AcrR family transcriptional regulator n=1 Tax=Aurantimicrobium minutum TaxID=708131 RepID=UPI002475E809|nr:TetR/AcrR family transcriptional regulator [Aurantimicrobium minutum]MDH6207036.1 AcrR family transcriptional regulator [Aurantimicrobium minutum]MDH6255765.1 AcrR family transcriptional regulator [Aurantimicrobium minutum]MDH6424371.1 AcrR family transcriptional regulator [Aurantimicrobium minutum]MDH6536229.1 AcrR family transcriptional regulator [Aurantimicrobium minutum]